MHLMHLNEPVLLVLSHKHQTVVCILLGRKSTTGNEQRKSRAGGASLKPHPGEVADSGF